MTEKQTVISAAGEAFAECPEQTPAEEQPEQEPEPEQPQESPEQEHLVTLSLPRVIELLAAERALAILQAHEPQENALDTVKTRLEISEILRASKRDKEDWHDAKRFKSRIKQIHKRLLMPDATRGFG